MIELTADKDIFIAEYNPYQNHYSSPDNPLFIGRFQQEGDSFRSLLRFNGFTTPVLEAHLLLYLYRNEIPFGTVKARIHRLLNSWEEITVTWNNQPLFNEEPDYTFIIPMVWTGYIIVPITAMVAGWVDGTFPNYGFIIRGDEHQNRVIGFIGTRSDQPDLRPRLLINCQ